jgi:uncharacterized membrane protein SpoIIM required for sporulation
VWQVLVSLLPERGITASVPAVILDLDHFIRREKPFWEELERALASGNDGGVASARRFHYLYERAASDLAKVRTFAAEPELRRYLEGLVGEAYARLHQRRDDRSRFRPIRWLFITFPATFRRHVAAFWMSLGLSLLGAGAGAGALALDPDNKWLLVPPQFGHLMESPRQRVLEEETHAAARGRQIGEAAPLFSTQLMVHNVKVALLTLALGILWGFFTCIMLFYNGVILGFVGYDYISDGQGVFLAGWLLPHGVPELTAIFIGGQAGLVLARAVIGWGTGLRLRQRLRLVRDDLATLAGGLAVMLVWAGLVEAFLSQHHGPSIYNWKITFGLLELVTLAAFLAFSGRGRAAESTR